MKFDECKEAIASIGRVAQDVIERLEAEFHEMDLYMAYRTFDLDAWANLVGASTSDASARRMEEALRKIGTALDAATDRHTWRAAAGIALKNRARQRVSASTPDPNLEFRMAWRAAMHDPGFPEPLLKAVRFYLATWDGTGAVERGLGQDAAIQKQHVGPRARNELDADLYSGLLEIHLDGPQVESEMFASTDGVLLLTDFSRACAQQWILQHGRRFACYKVRKDKGCRHPHRKKGTDRAVQMLAREAYKTQCHMANVDAALASAQGTAPAKRLTVFGKDRAKLMKNVRHLTTPVAGKKTKKYRSATLAKRAEKEAAHTWRGWGSGVPMARLGGAAAVEAATKSAATQAVRAKLFLSTKGRRKPSSTLVGASRPGASASTSSASAQSTWRRRESMASTPAAASAPKASSASTLAKVMAEENVHIIGTSLESLVKQRVDPDATVLTSWLKAVTQGGMVKCEGKRMALRPAIYTGCQIQISLAFSEKHPSLAKAMREAARASKGKWVVDSKQGQGGHHISRMRDMAAFLLHQRRVAMSDEASGLARSF